MTEMTKVRVGAYFELDDDRNKGGGLL